MTEEKNFDNDNKKNDNTKDQFTNERLNEKELDSVTGGFGLGLSLIKLAYDFISSRETGTNIFDGGPTGRGDGVGK